MPERKKWVILKASLSKAFKITVQVVSCLRHPRSFWVALPFAESSVQSPQPDPNAEKNIEALANLSMNRHCNPFESPIDLVRKLEWKPLSGGLPLQFPNESNGKQMRSFEPTVFPARSKLLIHSGLLVLPVTQS